MVEENIIITGKDLIKALNSYVEEKRKRKILLAFLMLQTLPSILFLVVFIYKLSVMIELVWFYLLFQILLGCWCIFFISLWEIQRIINKKKQQ